MMFIQCDTGLAQVARLEKKEMKLVLKTRAVFFTFWLISPKFLFYHATFNPEYSNDALFNALFSCLFNFTGPNSMQNFIRVPCNSWKQP
jgi:hypothetical protein